MHALAGDLPLPVVRLLSFMRRKGKFVDMRRAGPGFTLPANIGDLGPGITELDLGECNLIGALLLFSYLLAFLSAMILMREDSTTCL